jgi:acyl-CoA reductase-like NAD-dependent aldehyde dehydrogenase
VCTNGTRVFVPTALQQAFEAKIAERVAHIKAGDVFNPGTVIKRFAAQTFTAAQQARAFADAGFDIAQFLQLRPGVHQRHARICADGVAAGV